MALREELVKRLRPLTFGRQDEDCVDAVLPLIEGVEVKNVNLAYQVLQCQQVIAALILQFGKKCYQQGEPNQPAENCLFVDVEYETLEKVLARCKVFSLQQREERVLRLIFPLAQEPNGEAAPPTTQTGLQAGRCIE